MKQLHDFLWPSSSVYLFLACFGLFWLVLVYSCLTNRVTFEKFVSFPWIQFECIFKQFHYVIIIM